MPTFTANHNSITQGLVQLMTYRRKQERYWRVADANIIFEGGDRKIKDKHSL